MCSLNSFTVNYIIRETTLDNHKIEYGVLKKWNSAVKKDAFT